MAILFGSEEWIKALMEELNCSQAYAKAAEKWEGDFFFIVEPEGEFTDTIYYYMDLWHGKCRQAFRSADGTDRDPAFRMSAPLSAWKKVITKELDPIQGLLTRKLKLQGNLVTIVKNVKAAQELVECCTHIETEFPPV